MPKEVRLGKESEVQHRQGNGRIEHRRETIAHAIPKPKRVLMLPEPPRFPEAGSKDY